MFHHDGAAVRGQQESGAAAGPPRLARVCFLRRWRSWCRGWELGLRRSPGVLDLDHLAPAVLPAVRADVMRSLQGPARAAWNQLRCGEVDMPATRSLMGLTDPLFGKCSHGDLLRSGGLGAGASVRRHPVCRDVSDCGVPPRHRAGSPVRRIDCRPSHRHRSSAAAALGNPVRRSVASGSRGRSIA